MALAKSTRRLCFMGPRLRRLRRDLRPDPGRHGRRPRDFGLLRRAAGAQPAAGDGGHAAAAGAGPTRSTSPTSPATAAPITSARLQAVLKDPMFADIDMPSLEISDVATNYPGRHRSVPAALHRLSRGAAGARRPRRARRRRRRARSAASVDANDPVAEVRRFLAARRNNFPDPRRRRRAAGAGRRRPERIHRAAEGPSQPRRSAICRPT